MGRMEAFMADGYHGGNHSRLTPPVLCLFFFSFLVCICCVYKPNFAFCCCSANSTNRSFIDTSIVALVPKP